MVLRGFVILVGVLIVIIGLSQVITPAWWLNSIMPALMGLPALRIIGIVAIVIGGLFTLAVLRGVVGLRLFVLILGLLMLVGGIVIVFDPILMKNGVYAFFLNRGTGAQLTATRVAGIFRTLIGIALVYAGRRELVVAV